MFHNWMRKALTTVLRKDFMTKDRIRTTLGHPDEFVRSVKERESQTVSSAIGVPIVKEAMENSHFKAVSNKLWVNDRNNKLEDRRFQVIRRRIRMINHPTVGKSTECKTNWQK